MEIVIVENVSKKFSRNHHEAVRYGLLDIFEEFLGLASDSKYLKGHEFWAVNDVSFSLKKGESLGIIGINGSGKTTLLKMVSGIIRTDNGSITSKGKVVPLFAKGAGFDPVLSGYENVNINLSLLGLSKAEIRDVMEHVIDFSELSHEVLSSPVKTYSSGMHARLGFACAINSKPDILIVDEALAVGDMRFRTKCYRKLNDLKKNGCSLILVSHNTSLMLANCDRGLFLKGGKTLGYGNINDVVKIYEDSLDPLVNTVGKSISNLYEGKHQTGLSIKNIRILDFNDNENAVLTTGQSASIKISFITTKSFAQLNGTILVKDLKRNLENVLDLSSFRDDFTPSVSPGPHEWVVTLPVLNLPPGDYL